MQVNRKEPHQQLLQEDSPKHGKQIPIVNPDDGKISQYDKILGHPDLNVRDRIILYKIAKLTANSENLCTASTAYLSKQCGMSTRSVERALTCLYKNKYIKSKVWYSDDHLTIEKRDISLLKNTRNIFLTLPSKVSVPPTVISGGETLSYREKKIEKKRVKHPPKNPVSWGIDLGQKQR